jgi:hypothetical protein
MTDCNTQRRNSATNNGEGAKSTMVVRNQVRNRGKLGLNGS